MYSYVEGFEKIRKTLVDFLRNGINVSKLDPLDHMIETSQVDQIKILNSYRPLVDQRALFGATRNINNVVGVMKEKIKVARETHENPTTLELSLELIEDLSNLAPYIDSFITNNKTTELDRVNELSRILYKKAKYLGFCQDAETQLKNAEITEDEVKAFIEQLSENIEFLENEDES